MLQEITKAQLLALRLTRMMEAGSARPVQISLAKRNNVWMALECARKARAILGAAGITDRYPVIRHVMNLESVSTYEGTHDIHTLIVGRDITGIDAFGGWTERIATAILAHPQPRWRDVERGLLWGLRKACSFHALRGDWRPNCRAAD